MRLFGETQDRDFCFYKPLLYRFYRMLIDYGRSRKFSSDENNFIETGLKKDTWRLDISIGSILAIWWGSSFFVITDIINEVVISWRLLQVIKHWIMMIEVILWISSIKWWQWGLEFISEVGFYFSIYGQGFVMTMLMMNQQNWKSSFNSMLAVCFKNVLLSPEEV